MDQSNTQRRRRILLITAVILAGVFFCCGKALAAEDGGTDPGPNEEPEKLKPVKTTIKGFKKKYWRGYRGAIKDTVTVCPAYGRTLLLKRYDQYRKKWVLEKKIRTPDEWKARVSFWYKNTWRAFPRSSWALVAPKVKQRKREGRTLAPAKRRVLRSKIRVKKFHSAGHAVILDAKTGKCLYAYSATTPTLCASVRKMMTGVLLCEKKKPKAKIKVRELDRNTITLGLRSGDVVRAKDLLHAMFLPSSNDAASAAAAGVGGTHRVFLRMMNRKAKKLNMKRTRYSSPVGDQLNHRYKTTVYDQALLGKYIMESKTTRYLRKVLLKKKYRFTSLRYRMTYRMTRGNMLLGTKYRSIGIKTGYNDVAKWCFSNAWRYKGRLYISVVTECPTREKRWKSVKALTRFTRYAVNHKGKEVLVKE